MESSGKTYLREVTYGEITEKVNKIRIMNSDKRKRIQEISIQINDLSRELERLLAINDDDTINLSNIRNPRSQNLNDSTSPNYPEANFIPQELPTDFKIDNVIEVLNSYKGLKGSRGIVTKVTDDFIYFDISKNGIKTHRHRKNLKLIA